MVVVLCSALRVEVKVKVEKAEERKVGADGGSKLDEPELAVQESISDLLLSCPSSFVSSSLLSSSSFSLLRVLQLQR